MSTKISLIAFLFLGVFTLLPSSVHAAVLYDNSTLDGSTFTKNAGFAVQSIAGASSNSYATAIGQGNSGVSITGAAYVRVYANHQPYPNMGFTDVGTNGTLCSSSNAWTNISGNIWETTITGCTGNFGAILVSANASLSTDFAGTGTGGQTFDGSGSGTYLGSGLIAFQVCDSGGCSGGFQPSTQPAITQWNEVTRYWPGLNYATSTGTTTVGVQFSIPHPELIDGVGFELDGALDTSASTTVAMLNTLYTASTTVATSSTFSLTTDYNFTQGGYYTINAFFIQNGKRVWNNTIGTILINYVPPNITVGSDGQFHFNGTTTVATSTYQALHIDCGSTLFVSDICKLAVAFVVPDPSAIQQVKEVFNAMLTKAPFSFFTDSKKLLDAFQLGSASTGGTFALTLYGQSVPIISTTTASSIGLSSTPINVLKDLETIGLWILLAWYLYWRVASIFGV